MVTWRLLASLGLSWPVLASPGPSWPLLASPWPSLASSGLSWPLLVVVVVVVGRSCTRTRIGCRTGSRTGSRSRTGIGSCTGSRSRSRSHHHHQHYHHHQLRVNACCLLTCQSAWHTVGSDLSPACELELASVVSIGISLTMRVWRRSWQSYRYWQLCW